MLCHILMGLMTRIWLSAGIRMLFEDANDILNGQKISDLRAEVRSWKLEARRWILENLKLEKEGEESR